MKGLPFWEVPNLQSIPPSLHLKQKLSRIDAAFKLQREKNMYILSGSSYIAYHLRDRKIVEVGNIQDRWRNIWEGSINAVVNWANRDYLYFFKGAEYMRYELESEQVDLRKYPKTISPSWPGLWSDGVDAAVEWKTLDDTNIYFFKAGSYMRYNKIDDRVPPPAKVIYPKKTTVGWTNWPRSPLWKDGIVDAAINLENGKILFFKGNEYLCYDVEKDAVVSGYPKKNALVK